MTTHSGLPSFVCPSAIRYWPAIALLHLLIPSCAVVRQSTPRPPPSHAESSRTPPMRPSQPSLTPAPTSALTATPTLAIHASLQITYLGGPPWDTLYSLPVACLEDEHPCLGTPVPFLRIPSGILEYAWSPDGRRLLFAGGGGLYGDILVSNSDGSDLLNLTSSPELEYMPIWSPDGTKVAYFQLAADCCRIWSQRPISASPHGMHPSALLSLLPFTPAADIDWSPDGEHLAFSASYSAPPSRIFLSRLDGSDLRQLTYTPLDNFSPSFSPDGTRIVFARHRGSHRVYSSIIMLQISTRNESPVVVHDSWNVYPQWAPTGEWILFSSDRTGALQIYIVRSDGTGLTQVTTGLEHVSQAAWRSVPPR